jgi:hypothetical protein
MSQKSKLQNGSLQVLFREDVAAYMKLWSNYCYSKTHESVVSEVTKKLTEKLTFNFTFTKKLEMTWMLKIQEPNESGVSCFNISTTNKEIPLD